MGNGGTLMIETENVTLDEAFVKSHVGSRKGPHVRLSVTDSGCGMDGKTLKRIFEPFFTTKERGKGTGLGLATVYGIVKQSGGNIYVESEPGRGSRFEIYLPRTEERPSSVQMQPVAATEKSHGEVVLLVEDEPHVREIVEHMLCEAGYEVLTASGPDEALSICHHAPKRIHVMLTDVIMPGMNGIELSRQVHDILPDVRVMFMSGHSDELVKNLAGGEFKGVFLQKPFQSQAVVGKIREILLKKDKAVRA
jgi:two-component system, cell cycle sensor histidine kinase and response regulator CckA